MKWIFYAFKLESINYIKFKTFTFFFSSSSVQHLYCYLIWDQIMKNIRFFFRSYVWFDVYTLECELKTIGPATFVLSPFFLFPPFLSIFLCTQDICLHRDEMLIHCKPVFFTVSCPANKFSSPYFGISCFTSFWGEMIFAF